MTVVNDEMLQLTHLSSGARGSPDGSASLPPTESFQRMAQIAGHPRRPIQPAGKHERLLPNDRMEQGGLSYDEGY